MRNAKPNWLVEMEADDKRRCDRLPAAKAAILKSLKAARAAHVTIEYDGEGDSGQVSSIAGRTTKGKTVKLAGKIILDLQGQPQAYATLEQALDDFAWALLGVYHGGFVNNDGGFGTIQIDVGKGTVTIDHNDRVIDVCNSVTEV